MKDQKAQRYVYSRMDICLKSLPFEYVLKKNPGSASTSDMISNALVKGAPESLSAYLKWLYLLVVTIFCRTGLQR